MKLYMVNFYSMILISPFNLNFMMIMVSSARFHSEVYVVEQLPIYLNCETFLKAIFVQCIETSSMIINSCWSSNFFRVFQLPQNPSMKFQKHTAFKDLVWFVIWIVWVCVTAIIQFILFDSSDKINNLIGL